MYLDRALEEALKDPEKRITLYVTFNLGLVAVNITIAVGLGVLFLRFIGII